VTDLSQISNEELMRAAGIAPAPASGPDLSGVSTEDLLKAANATPKKPFNVLPLSEDANGKVSFDIHAGLPGAILRAVTAPYDAMTGKFDPMSPEGQQRAFETALTISPGSVAMRAGERAIPGELMSLRREKVKPPSADELRTAASKGYDAARDTGAEYPGQTVASAVEDAQRGMQSEGILAELAPQTFSILSKLQNPPEGAVVTIASLDAARKALNRVAGNFGNPTEQEAARRVIRRIDDLITGGNQAAAPAGNSGSVSLVPSPAPGASAANGAGLGGSPAPDAAQMAAARFIKEARGNAAAGFRSDRITGAEDAAELRSAAANSGQNLGNTLRQRLASILLSDKQSRGFSPEELAAMRQVVEGTATANTLRYVGNLLGGGGGIGQTGIATLGAAGGAALGGGPVSAGVGAALLPLTGATSRAGYNALVGRQVAKLDELVRKRSPLYQQRANAAPLIPERSDTALGLLLRGLLLPQAPGGLLGDPSQSY
jgi:hypothetical protein